MVNEKVSVSIPGDYVDVFASLKQRVRLSQTKAMLSVNREMIQLYWDIGGLIALRRDQDGWGKKTVERLARDLQSEFPGIKGFSATSIWRIRAFFLAYEDSERLLSQTATELDDEVLSQPVTEPFSRPVPAPFADIPWGHNQVLLFKLKDSESRRWYATKAIEHGWSRAVLTVQIETCLLYTSPSPRDGLLSRMPSSA